MVARIFADGQARANAVRYFNRYAAEERVVPAKRVILGAGCVDLTQILLNSVSRQFPSGLGKGARHQFEFRVKL